MLQKSDYTIGWVCALRTELVAAIEHLDEEHDPKDYSAAPNDNNSYNFGSIQKHNIVIATLPNGEYGTSSAATVARDMIRSFTNIRIGLMVGIGGGAPLWNTKQKQDVRLGDVVVSKPSRGRGGVLQYDFGSTIQNKQFKLNGFLNSPPQSILTTISTLGAHFEGRGNALDESITALLEKNQRLRTTYQRPSQDHLYQSFFTHKNEEEDCSYGCYEEFSIQRDPRKKEEDVVKVHEGIIASSNQLMKNALIRDRLATEGVLCFEMEAAGLMNQFPFLVIRGICDYSDTHKNDEWQGYAAMTAAAYTRRLLLRLPPTQVAAESRLSEIEKQLQKNLEIIQSNVVQYTARCLRADIEQWLAASDPETDFESNRDQRASGTGGWLADFDAYSRWKTGSIRHLWLYGKAGCGKSVISASIIEEVRRICANGTADMGHAIFYFTFSNSSKQSHIDCLRSIVYQLSTCRSVSTALEQLFDLSNTRQDSYSRQGGHSATEEDLQKILLSGIRSYRNFFLVLDALDESPELDAKGKRKRENLLEWLQVLSFELPSLKILATSRCLPDIQARLREMRFHQHSMVTELVNIDIIKFVVSQLNQDQRLRDLDSDMKKEIQDTFMEKADGMFQWATCQMNRLRNFPSTRREHLRAVLKSLPASLDETYDRIIATIPPEVQDDASILLRWLTYSHRPLTILELSEARIINTANGSVAFDDRGHIQDVLGILSCLILVGKSGDKAPISNNHPYSTVRLAHSSVQEYLETTRESMNKPPPFCFQMEREHRYISRSCLVYLSHCVNTKAVTRTSQDLRMFPLLHYAASFWHTHCRKTDYVDQVVRFLRSDAFAYCQLIHSIHQPWTDPLDTYLGDMLEAPLHFAAWAGLANVARKLIEAESDFYTQDKFYGDVLQTASCRGHDSIVAILIEAGANVNARSGGYYGNALQAASYEGHDSVVELLIKSKANVNARGGRFGNALQAASCRGHESIVKMLVNAGASVNAYGGEFGNALQASSSGGHESIVRMLIEAGAHVDTKAGGAYGSALQAASWRGHDSIIKRLILAGTNVNAQAGEYGNALQAASYEGHDSVVNLLIEAGARIETQGGYYGNALQAAAAAGHESIVRILIEAGADVNAQVKGAYSNALQAASRKGHDSIVRMLREAGCHTIAQSGDYTSRIDLLTETRTEML